MTATFDVASVLSPVSTDVFVDRYFDREPLHIGRADAGHFDQALSFADFDALLSRPAIPANNLFAIGVHRKLTPADYSLPDGSADVLRLLDLFDEGATLVFREADRAHLGLWHLCRSFERALEAPAFANIYYAPPGGQAFHVHYDAVDVFALQLDGRKRWTLFEPVGPKPFRDQHCYEAIEGAVETRMVDLEAGATLYVPRGVPHQVAAHDGNSLHVSISVSPFTGADLRRLAFDSALSAAGSHRDAIVPANRDRTAEREEPPYSIPEITASPFEHWRQSSLLAQVPVAIDRPLARRHLGDDIGPETVLQADTAMPVFVQRLADHVRLVMPGRSIGFVGAAAPALERVLSRVPFSIAELMGLDDEGARMDLVRVLIRSGLVSPV